MGGSRLFIYGFWGMVLLGLGFWSCMLAAGGTMWVVRGSYPNSCSEDLGLLGVLWVELS